MDCRACHGSGSIPDAMPYNGWVWASNPERDYRLNILRLHDDHMFAIMPEEYSGILSSNGFNVQGLYRTVTADGRPILCAKCHRSNALPGTGFASLPPLTTVVHERHAEVMDPDLNLILDDINHRAACYRCHPGSTTRCLRGGMGDSIAADGSRAIQCQSCHGTMSAVASSSREGWLNEPNCQSCHTGTATSNNGKIRYTTCFETNGQTRVAVNQTFATTPGAPAAGLSLYRFSRGHGGLQCAACHNSTHAEYPSGHSSDNLRAINHQGHVGVISECTACHATMPNTQNKGPHGMHPVGESWVDNHRSAASSLGRAWCANCHGADFRGTVLSRASTDRTLSYEDHSVRIWRGFKISCYTCHQGPYDDDENPNEAPAVTSFSASTTSGLPLAKTLAGSDANGDPLAWRIVTQPAHGAVGLLNGNATYTSDPGYVGTDTFTFAANDGSIDSNIGTGTVLVSQGPVLLSATAHVPSTYPATWSVPFGIVATASNLNATATHSWDFNDGSPSSTDPFPSHSYLTPGSYNWRVISSVQGPVSVISTTNVGTIQITAPVTLEISQGPPASLSWTLPAGDALLEVTPSLGPDARWGVDTNWMTINGNQISVKFDNPGGLRFYRLRQL
jgi:hypothetical protein